MGRKVKKIKPGQRTMITQGTGKHKEFWNKEYKSSEHLALSMNVSEDLEKFIRWMEREHGRKYLNPLARVLDIGTGNGRNIIYLSNNYGMRGVGFDISEVAIAEAEKNKEDLPIDFSVRSMAEPLPLADGSATIVLDMMSSHFLKKAEREALLAEIVRVLKPGGWLFFKSFLADEDLHVKRLLKESPAEEEGAYIHPKIGVYEYVWTEEDAVDFFAPFFQIHKIQKSHKHINRGKIGDERAWKRRTFSMYLQKLG
jgi:ubiquinone/menaquinone biosynthesis C-methylase UbiE